ncbi:phosphoglucomutase, partial [Treponema pallidum]
RSIAFGFVPDCDGDRGNIVYYDQTLNRAVIPHEQAVFALSVVSEICELSRNLRMQPHRAPPIALVTNGPTSL